MTSCPTSNSPQLRALSGAITTSDPSTTCGQGSWMQKALGAPRHWTHCKPSRPSPAQRSKGTPQKGPESLVRWGGVRTGSELCRKEGGVRRKRVPPGCLCSHLCALSAPSLAPSPLCSRTTEPLPGARSSVKDAARAGALWMLGVQGTVWCMIPRWAVEG